MRSQRRNGRWTVRALACVVGTLAFVSVPAHAYAKKPPTPSPVIVRGGWLNEASCVPAAGEPSPDLSAVRLECEGGTTWNGDLTGHTILHFIGTYHTSGAVEGEYEELFVGTYAGDHSVGTLSTKGYFVIDEKGSFLARAQILSGTCDWAGSSGTIAYDGYQINGGYVGEWYRPQTAPTSAPCPPVTSPHQIPKPKK
jgi:hypothetical protein